MIFDLRKTCAASSIISYDSFDSAMFSLSCLIPVPPVLAGPFLSITLSHSLLAASPSGRMETSSLITSNSPRNRASFFMSIPGTVSTRPSKEALIWNSLKRQAATLPVVALDRPTWSLRMIGVLMELPTMAAVMVSKSTSLGDAELQMGTLMCTRPGNFSNRAAIDSWRVTMVFTSISFSCLLTSSTLTLLSLAFIWPSHTRTNSASSSSSCLLVTFPSSAYSPILFGGLAHTGSPLMYTVGSCLILNQMIFLSLG